MTLTLIEFFMRKHEPNYKTLLCKEKLIEERADNQGKGN